MPGMGVAKPEIRRGLRMPPLGDYLILYEATEGAVKIVRVLHGARDWRKML